MTEANKYGLDDLVISAIEQRPTDFEAAFNDLIVDRISNAIENKKIEFAQQMYGYEPEADYEEDAEDQDIDNSEEEDYGEET
jgi:hypothetical protein